MSEGGGFMESVATPSRSVGAGGSRGQVQGKERCGQYFQMPLHYPRYTRTDYETMAEWKLDCLLREYGLPITGDVDTKRNYAMGAFLWST